MKFFKTGINADTWINGGQGLVITGGILGILWLFITIVISIWKFIIVPFGIQVIIPIIYLTLLGLSFAFFIAGTIYILRGVWLQQKEEYSDSGL